MDMFLQDINLISVEKIDGIAKGKHIFFENF
ncbi:hypothetical protein J2W47_006300 [Priestia megaterium]|nr:hypothetical protein [Priestia megaterium]